ncbi:hypothetical protein ACUXZJ_07070 [Flavobacterium sp. TN-1]
MNEFDEYNIRYQSPGLLFNSEIERIIIDFVDKNNLSLPDDFKRSNYRFFQQIHPTGIEYSFLFLARKKTDSEILREQIEFQIKQLER